MNTESKKIKRLSPFAQAVVRTTRNYFKKSKPLSEVIPPIFPSYFDDHEPGADGWVHSQFKKEVVHG